ncbi:MAG: YwbE family protein [Bacteroidota bacterium]
MNGTRRANISIGARVLIVEKQNQRRGETTEGYVARILTSKPVHSRGIKVKLETGEVGRVQEVLPEED